jgi:uncharacterized protein YbjQ (UPF0145 family)
MSGSGTPRGGDPAARTAAWNAALQRGRLPDSVVQRLADAGAARTPWLATMTPAELLLSRSHGIRPIATVSGTCWQHYGFSWTNGHAEGWHAALGRLRQEAVAAGANAIVDVQLRTIRMQVGSSMDFTVLGTAVRIDGLPPSPEPVIATVPALEFVRLLEAGIVPTGVAIGAHYEWLYGNWTTGTGAMDSYWNQPLTALSKFWEQVRMRAVQELKADAGRLGNGVLAHTHFGELLQHEYPKGEMSPPKFLGRFIVIGTAVQCRRNDAVPHAIRMVVDMRDDLSPLRDPAAIRHNAGPVAGDEAGAI